MADELSPALIVMANHGRGVLSRFVVESVAAEVLKRAATPVLLLRPPQTLEERGTIQPPVERSAV